MIDKEDLLNNKDFYKSLMYYSQMWKNDKLYNVEVLYDDAIDSQSILFAQFHFKINLKFSFCRYNVSQDENFH
ncbi:hypothetical protein EG349_15830 [Chryseobacterium shandongense]|uniref:Uncharacterized protein n=1 Tax=Chryseobacterium shandongense TaxID=1493872 RepID=A0AAD1DMX3_9FLAO|nr:hypothetical protein EG349_15830 [Chryseobacterium shandongense]AZA96719.1 hypothetical protein EG353_14620 [Chryseobacterium shandongense]